MLQEDWFMLMGVGGVFILIGLVILILGKREERGYYEALSAHRDLREYLVHQPERSEPGALKIGGWIAIAIGLIMLAVGGAFLLWG